MNLALEVWIRGERRGAVEIAPGETVGLRLIELPQAKAPVVEAGAVAADACPCGSQLPFATCVLTHTEEPEE